MEPDFIKYLDELVTLRRHFHMYPELPLREFATAEYIEAYIKDLGLSSKRIEPTGVVTEIRGPKATRTIAVRAEMDALPLREKNEIPCRSLHEGISHACGHDAILAIALVLLRLCQENRDALPVNVRFLFQPAEETSEGTTIFLAENVLEGCDYFLMYHMATDRPRGMDLHRGPSSAAIGSIEAEVTGRPAHWAGEGERFDAVYAAAKVIEAVHDIDKSFTSPYPHVAGIGMVTGGTAKNIVAGHASLKGTIRSSDMEEYRRLRREILSAISEVEKNTGTKIHACIDEAPIPPIISDPELVDLFYREGSSVFGPDCIISDTLYLSGDSAAFYFEKARGVFPVFTAAFSSESGRKNHPLHSSRFDFDESVLPDCVKALYRCIMAL